jgi:hypothetical protein
LLIPSPCGLAWKIITGKLAATLWASRCPLFRCLPAISELTSETAWRVQSPCDLPTCARTAVGVHFFKVLERLGIVEEMKAKTKYPILGALVGSMLDSGEVDHAVQSIPELIFVQGVDLVGPLPGDLQAITTYAVGVPASAKEPDAARALISLLRSPEAVSIIKAKGLDPG